MLTAQQQTAINVLNSIGVPCGLITILSKSKGAFGSKALLKKILQQLILLDEVTCQSNSQYKISASKAKTTTKVKAKAKTKVKPTPIKKNAPKLPVSPSVELKVVPKVFTLPKPLTESLAVLESKLKKGELSIHELSLKIEVLQRLSLLLSEDISDVLSNIAKDLIEANTAA